MRMEQGIIDVFFTRNDQRLETSRWEKYLAKIPIQSQRQCMKYIKWQDGQACLFGKLLLIECLKSYGFLEEKIFDCQLGNYGKPFIPRCIDFNVSHSGNYAVCAATMDCGEIGIDVEKISSVSFADFETILNSKMIELIKMSPSPYREMVKYWASIESAIKADGRGLNISFDNITSDFEKNVVAIEGRKWIISDIDLDNEHLCCVASTIQNYTINVSYIDFFC